MKKESIKVLQDNLDLLTKRHNSLIEDGKYNEAFNVMKNIEMVMRQLDFLNIPIISEDTKKDNQFFDWYSILKFFIETKQTQLIQLDYTSHEKELLHRGTGKTTALVKLSSEYKIPIYTKKSHEFVYRDRAKEFNLNPILVTEMRDLNLKQYNQKNIVLVDEFNKDVIDTDKYTVIGFRQCTKE